MPRSPMLPSQPSDDRTPGQRFDALAKRLFAVPKAHIDRQEKKEEKAKKRKAG